jgi:hypothetical protein
MPPLARTIAVGLLLTLTAGAAAAGQVLPERDACEPATSAKSRDGNCVPCPTGAISRDPGFLALVERVRARRAGFDDDRGNGAEAE